MIRINNIPFTTEYFPDGTQRLNVDGELKEVTLNWQYENDSELFTLLAINAHYKELGAVVSLQMPYIPNARMDRTKSNSEVFTLKYFCKLINDANFKTISVLDAHSSVSLALLDRVEVMDIAAVIRKTALDKLPKDIILYFPDEGSQKRYSTLFPEYRYITGMKKRDWSTGRIDGLDVITNGLDLTGKTILMIDDIIAYGGSFYYSAKTLKGLGAGSIYAYSTHTENSVLNEEKGTFRKLLDDGTVECLFTTDSLFTGTHKSIQVTSL